MENPEGAGAPGETPATDAESAEAAYERFVWKHLPRNFAGMFTHGMLGMTGFRLFNAPTFLPTYLYTLSGSNFVVGLGQSLQQIGSIVSPVVGATHIEHRKRVLPSSMWLGALMRVQILGVAAVGFFLHGLPLLLSVLGFLFLLGLFSGAQGVAFELLLAKLIPITRRGRLQALRNASGGAVAAVLAWAAGHYIIQHNLFGNGYGTTFLLAFVLTSLGLIGLGLLVREPEPPTVRIKSRVMDRMREFPTLMRQDKAFMFFIIAQALATAASVAAPFYILFAGRSMPLNGQNLGLLSLAFIGSSVITNLGWGVAGDQFGFRAVFIASVASWIGATGLLMAAPMLGLGHVIDTHTLILIAFFGLGAAQAGFFMSCQTMVLEFGAREDLAMRLGFANSAQGVVAAIGPLAGGLIAALSGYEVLFGISLVFLTAALLIILILVEEPRFRGLA